MDLGSHLNGVQVEMYLYYLVVTVYIVDTTTSNYQVVGISTELAISASQGSKTHSDPLHLCLAKMG